MEYICDSTQSRCQRVLDQVVGVGDDRGLPVCVLAVLILHLNLYVLAVQVVDHLEGDDLGVTETTI